MSVFTRLLGELVSRLRGRGRAAGAEPGTRDAAAVSALFQQCVGLSGSGDLDKACDCYHRLLDPAGVVDEVGRALGERIGAARKP